MAKIKDLFKQVEEKKIILPNFQREFVWERDQQKNLLASLFTSITIGSVLFLEGKKGVFTAREIGHKKNIDDQSDLKDDLIYLLDGQQRFTCIKSFFSDLFEDKSTESYNKFFPKIRNRWFLHLSENSDNFLGYHNLIFNKEKYRISTPTDIKDDIICKMDICRATSKSFYDISEELKEKKTDLIGNRWIPIQLMYGEMEVVEQILISIGESRKIELEYELTDDEKIELLTPVEKNIKELFKTHEKEKDDKKKTEVYIKIQQAWMKVYNKWASDVKSFLESIMSADIPSINITEEQLPKASAIFEHINKGGTPLSTFDLFCAKFHNLDLRESLKTTLNNSIETPKDLLNENFSEWKPINFGVLTQNEGSFSKSFQDQFLNTLSLLSHIKKHGVDKITVAHIKRDTILELIEDDVKDFIVPAINGLIRTYCFLQMRCGLRKIENISYELLILPLTVILSNDTYWKKQSAAKRIKVFNSLEYFYWISIFSGRYSKDQNERSISDIKTYF